jgi:hypothetical protein
MDMRSHLLRGTGLQIAAFSFKDMSLVAPAGAAVGLAGRKLDSWVGTFGSFTIGDEVIHNVKLRIADLFGKDTVADTRSNLARPVEGLPGSIIGCDFFLAHRLLVLFSEHKLLFSFNRGPIFQTIESSELPVADTGSSSGIP